MEMIGNFFSAFLAKIGAVLLWMAGLVTSVFIAAWDMLTDLYVWLFDQLLGLVVSAVQSINLSGIPGLSAISAYWSQVPAEMLNMLSYTGFGPAFAIVASALGVRLVLQLIPFVRLGS